MCSTKLPRETVSSRVHGCGGYYARWWHHARCASDRAGTNCRYKLQKDVVYPAKGVRQLGGRGGPLRGGSSSPAAPVLSDCEAVGSPNHRLQNQSPTTHRVQKLWSWCTAVLYACAQPVPCCTSSAARVQSTHGDAMLCTRNLDALHRLLGSFFT